MKRHTLVIFATKQDGKNEVKANKVVWAESARQATRKETENLIKKGYTYVRCVAKETEVCNG